MVTHTDEELVRDITARSASRGLARRRASSVFAGCALILMTVVVYWPAIRGPFIWDDVLNVQENRALRTADGLGRIWTEFGATMQYYPIAYTSFWIDYQLWGLNPVGYHVVNFLLHGAAAVLFWRWLVMLGVPGAWVAAAVFAWHPVHVESVAFITERKNVLSTVFYLGAALCFCRFVLPCNDEVLWPRRIGWYVAAIVLFVFALLSKTVTCSLPAVLLLIVWWKRGWIGLRDLLGMTPLIVIGLGLGLVTIWMEKRGGTIGHEWDRSALERLLIAARALWFYVGSLIWPARLTFLYPKWSIDVTAWWQYSFVIAAGVVPVCLWLARRAIGLGPLVAVLMFAGTLVPVLGFFNVYYHRYSFVADHFLYLASLGLISLFVGAGRALIGRIDTANRRIAIIAAVCLLGMLGWMTWNHSRVYRSAEAVWQDTLEKNSDAWPAHIHLGSIMWQRDRQSDAISHYRSALRINPNAVIAHNNLGALRWSQGKYDMAVEHYQAALRINPEFARANFNFGQALEMQGNIDEAIKLYRRAVHVKRDYVIAHYRLAKALQAKGEMDEATDHYRRVLEIELDHRQARQGLAEVLDSQPTNPD